jgi:hypothetical protein
VVSVFIPAASQNFDAVSTCSVLSSLSGVEWKGANLHADNPAVSVLLVVVLSRNSTKSQRGQIHDYRSLSVPQLSPAAFADRFESYWESDIFSKQTSHYC